MKRGWVLLVLLVAMWQSMAQVMEVRSNVTPYNENSAVERLAYTQSPFYYELSGSWKQHRTDSSVVYTRQIKAEKVWKEYLVTLSVRCGHRQRLRVNGKEVGVVGDSRLYAEYNIGSYLKYGKDNTIAIEALRNGAETLLEDPAIEVGLNGEPFILFKSDPGIEDYSVEADYDAQTGQGSIYLQVTVNNSSRKGKYYVEAELLDPHGKQFDRMGRWVVFDKKNAEVVELSRTWNNINAWSAEAPHLYTLIVRLRDEGMAEEEMVGARIGFRHIELQDGLLKLNGRPITLKGATYSIEHTEGEASRQQISRDLALLKQHNFNAIRTSRYSPMDDYFYELCDQYGLYVVCDANLMPHSSRQHAVATDANFVPLFERRVENMYRRLKNHASIVAWSLGNSRDNGVGMGAAYRRLKALDKQRPTIFSGADMATTTDIVAPQMPTTGALKATVAKTKDRPIVVAAMGATDFEAWELVNRYANLQGGFIDKWPLSADELEVFKQQFMPLDIAISTQGPDEIEFVFENKNCFVGLGDYLIEYTILTNLRPNVVSGDLPLAMAGGGQVKERIRIPQLDMQPGEELFIRFDMRLRKKQEWSRVPRLNMGTIVFPLAQQAVRLTPNYHQPIVAKPVGDTLVVLHPDWTLYIGLNNGTISVADTSGNIQSISRPLVVDAKGGYGEVNITASNYNTPQNGVAVVELMGTVVTEGVKTGEVKLEYTILSSNDVLIDYTFKPTGNNTMCGGIWVDVPSSQSDTACWYGTSNSKLTTVGTRHSVPIIYHDILTPTDTVCRAMQWCRLGKQLFIDYTGVSFVLKGNKHSYAAYLNSHPNKKSRVHLHWGDMDEEESMGLSATDYPHIPSGIAQAPSIKGASGRFSGPMQVMIAAQGVGEIHYTTDGTDPSKTSPVYKQPFTIENTTTVKARLFPKEGTPSFVATRHFNYDHISAVSYSRQPSVPYNVGADTLLFDGNTGSTDDLTQGWLGFSTAESVLITANLSKSIDVQSVQVRFLHSPATWAFAPRSVAITLLNTNAEVVSTGEYDTQFDVGADDETEARVVIMDIPVQGEDVSRVVIQAKPMGRIPAWHRAKGLNPWLLIDEIEVIEHQ